MKRGEFGLIERLAAAVPCRRHDVVAGPGDDAALLRPPPGMDLAQTVDACLEGVHFPAGLPPDDLGWRSLAVNLSDLAAMGAEPAWAVLVLAMPEADEDWLDAFARGFGELAGAAGVDLVGGDMVRGPLAVTVALTGFVPPGAALRRSGARPGDSIWVAGTLGGGAAGLAAWRRGDPASAGAFLRPRARLEEGRALRGLATAAIDVSDGLAQDLGHVLEASGVGAMLELDTLPLATAAAAAGRERGEHMALHGGDDYALCFTLPAARAVELAARASRWPAAPVRIGEIKAGQGLELRRSGQLVTLAGGGWDHFRGTPE